MIDWMAFVVAEARRQGWRDKQTRKGCWYFRHEDTNVTVMVKHTPTTEREWNFLLDALRSQGFRTPSDE